MTAEEFIDKISIIKNSDCCSIKKADLFIELMEERYKDMSGSLRLELINTHMKHLGAI